LGCPGTGGVCCLSRQPLALGPNTPLFDNSEADIANRCREFRRDDVGITATNKHSNGWRKRFINGLLDLKQSNPEIDCDEDRRRYIAGHAGADAHARRYLKHPVHKTKPILDLLPVPAPLAPRLVAAVA
jgi:hypothetical protein